MKKIIALITQTARPSDAKLQQAKKCGTLILSQLCLMESFVEDLLNLRLMREGILTIAQEKFDSRECLESIVSMFAIKSELQGVTISYSLESSLEVPDDNYRLCIDKRDNSELLQPQIFNTQDDCTGELPRFLMGDSRRLKQVLINLVKNALKFTPSGKIQMKICYLEPKKLLVVHVEDTGAGISAEDFPKLFRRFGKL